MTTETKRFEFVQKHDGYVDYDTALGSLEESDLSEGEIVDLAYETIRRVTFDEELKDAYLTMRDYSEKRISWEEAEGLVGEKVISTQGE